ncbi:MAG TPA: septum formation initiator family protein [Acidiferrobacteraceae bacterium]|nr:septum formation initiator family protein [Acidiferrobacteraceae bacterium]
MNWLRRSRTWVLLAVLGGLQYDLWIGQGGVLAVWHLRSRIAAAEQKNALAVQRNQALAAEVADLKRNGLASAQEAARSQLGMIRRNETFYQVLPGVPVTRPFTPYPDGPGIGYGKEPN